MTPRSVLNSQLAVAFSRRWRTTPSQSSMNLAAGFPEASDLLPAVGGTKVQVGRGQINENYAEILRDKGFMMRDPAGDPETEHETWRGRGLSILIDRGGNEWHHMVNGVVKETGSLDDDSLRQYVGEANDAQSPDMYRTSPQSANDTDEPRFLRMAKAELARRRDLRCPDCGFMGLPAGDGQCPNCGGHLQDPREKQNVQDFAEMRRAIIAQVKEQKR